MKSTLTNAVIGYCTNKFTDTRSIMYIRICTTLFAALLCHFVFGQPGSFADELRSKLDRYYSEHVPLNADAQFNQPSYAPGDTAWFSLWLTTERGGLPVEGRQIIHVDLSTRSGSVIQQVRVLATNGKGQGQIIVPLSVEPGIYTVTFSTGWTANENNTVCGYKELTISGDHGFTRGVMPLKSYVEGGVLVEGVSNELLITGKPGATVSLATDGNVLERVTLGDLGYGRITVNPISPAKYTVSDGTVKVDLPAPRPGIGLTLSLYDSASIALFKVRASNVGGSCRLVLVSQGRMIYTAMVTFQSRSETIAVPRSSLPPGLILATVFDEHNEPVAQRVFLATISNSPIIVTSQQTIVHPRERIPVTIKASDFVTPLTVSVYAGDVFLPAIQMANATVASVARLPVDALNFPLDSSWNLRQWNNFLITQEWKRFSWRDILGETHHDHRAEKYLRIKGRIQRGATTAIDSVRITFFLRNDTRVYEEFVDQTGAFDLELFFDFYDTEEVVFVVDRKGVVLRDVTLSLDPGSSPQVKLTPASGSAQADPYTTFAKFRKSIADAYTSYDKTALSGAVADPNAAVEEELFSADITVRLDDYLVFPTMEETLREIVPKLQHRWKGKRHTVSVALTGPDALATDDPMYFIDGVLTDNTDYFMGLRPQDVSTIKIVSMRKKLAAMGILGANGIVLVTTKIPDNHLKVPRTANSFLATGITAPLRFQNLLSFSSRTPLLRSTAYFNSSIIPDAGGNATVELLVPDNTGTLLIEVTGVTRSGTLCRAITYLRSVPPTSAP